MERHDRLRQARIAAGFERATDAAERFGWNANTYKSNENGAAPFSFKKAKDYAKAFGVRAEWLYDAAGPMKAADEATVRVIGRAGADTEGRLIHSDADQTFDRAPARPGATTEEVAVEIVGDSMRAIADDGALLYFRDQRNPPSPDMIGFYCIVELEDGRVLFKRLLRGSEPDTFMLESLYGPPIDGVRIRWAAEPTAIIPAKEARRMILRSGERQVA